MDGSQNRAPAALFHRPDYGLVVMAGLWKWQRSAEGSVSQVFVILTTSANALMEPIHHRMPVVLEESRLDDWMDPGNADAASLRTMLVPPRDDFLVAEPASPLVNNVKNDGPQLLSVSD